jgi:glycosyltransferase involved in cell wall biosynthesis
MNNIFDCKNCFEEYKNVKNILLYGNYKYCLYPKISVLMPIYNRPELFKIALKSVIDQNCDFEYEIVIVDNNPYDGKKDKNQEIIESFGSKNIFYYRNYENIGAFNNWNRCIELARAEYVTYCHDDDMLLPSCLNILKKIQSKSGTKAIFSANNFIDGKGGFIYKKNERKKVLGIFSLKTFHSFSKLDIFMSCPGCNSVLFYKKHLKELGGFDNEYQPSSDYVLFINYIFKYGSVYNEIPTSNYRIYANSSFELYNKFADIICFSRECMMPKMFLPSFVLKVIKNAKENDEAIDRKITFEKASKTLKKSISLRDKLIIYFLKCMLKLKAYKIKLY